MWSRVGEGRSGEGGAVFRVTVEMGVEGLHLFGLHLGDRSIKGSSSSWFYC